MSIMLLTGIIGLMAMTGLFPVMLRIFPWLKVNSTKPETVSHSRKILTIIIPAHNEEAVIGETLASIRVAVEKLNKLSPEVIVRVKVGVDASTDKTAIVAEKSGAQIRVFEKQQGKWAILRGLLKESRDSDWIAFADAGSLWEEDLLTGFTPWMYSADVIGVAPSYSEQRGTLKNLIWKFEALIKRFENQAGGPVSVHGATVFYRRPEVLRVFEENGEGWLNDDVVVPLLMRAANPGARIVYDFHLRVSDAGSSCEAESEYRRRARIVKGNSQWIMKILPRVMVDSPVVGVLALRRVFRVFWFYWVLFFFAGMYTLLSHLSMSIYGSTVFLDSLALAAFVGTVSVFVVSAEWRKRLQSVGAVVRAGYKAPVFFFSADEIGWK